MNPHPSAPLPPSARLRRLHRLPLVLAVSGVALAIFLAGLLLSPYPYNDPRFAGGFLVTELVVTGFLLLATATLFPFDRIGFRPPVTSRWRGTLPLLVLCGTAVAAWVTIRLGLPPEAVDDRASLVALRTTLLVGLNEEWLFRGILLAGLAARFGLKRGALVALLVFGAFHAMNVVAGVPLASGLLQVGATTLIGATLLLAAVATRSLWLPILAHGVYDFAVLDLSRVANVGGAAWPIVVILVVGAIAGITSLVAIVRLEGGEPYAE